MKSDGILYDFPVRLSITVRDSVLAFEVTGRPMVVAWVGVDVEHKYTEGRSRDLEVARLSREHHGS